MTGLPEPFRYEKIQVSGTIINTAVAGRGKPAPDAANTVYAKRALAGDQVEVMRRLGFDRFQLVCHDRGARVGHRLVLDHPDAVDMLGNEPEFWIRAMIERLLPPGASIEPEVMDEYIRCFSDPATIAATCADYRAGGTTDLSADDASAAAGEKITCPTLVLWGERSFVAKEYQPMEVWREYATDVRGHALPAGHFLPEEVPGLILDELRSFL